MSPYNRGIRPSTERVRSKDLPQYGHAAVAARIEATPAEQLATTIITIAEHLTGWYTQVRQAGDVEILARAYKATGGWNHTQDRVIVGRIASPSCSKVATVVTVSRLRRLAAAGSARHAGCRGLTCSRLQPIAPFGEGSLAVSPRATQSTTNSLSRGPYTNPKRQRGFRGGPLAGAFWCCALRSGWPRRALLGASPFRARPQPPF